MADPSPEPALEDNAPATLLPPKIRWKNDQAARTTRKNVKCVAAGSSTSQATNIPTRRNRDAIRACAETLGHPDVVEGYVDRPSDKALIPMATSIHRWVAPLNSQARMLMSHCKFFL